MSRAQGNTGAGAPTQSAPTPGTPAPGTPAPSMPNSGANLPSALGPLQTTPSGPPSSSLTFPAPPTASAPGAQATGILAAINIQGNINISADAIRQVLRQKVAQPYSDTAAESDRQAIQDMGYFSAVTLHTDVDPQTGEVTETYNVVENPRVSKIVITGNTVISTAKLLSLMETKPGEVLNTNTLAEDIQALMNYYRQQGYIASISEDINIDPTTGVLTVPIVEARISSITITGNRRTKTWVITREFKSKVGDVYNENKFRQDLVRVYNTGLFDSVGPADRSTPGIGKIALTVPVTERRSGQVSVGVGYSATEKLVGEATLSENNFRGRGETISLQWTVGGIESQSSVELSFGDPWFDKYHDGFDIDLYNKALYRFDNSFFSGPQVSGSSQYLERHKGGTLTLSRPFSDTTTGFVSGRIESVSTNNISVPLSDTFIRQNVNLSGLGFRVANDTRDNALNPATGGYEAISIEGVSAQTSTINNAPTPLAPGHELFTKVALDIRHYFSLQGPRRKSITELKKVFAVRLLIGDTAQDIPFSEQYFLGGPDTLRGYDQDRFWGNHLLLINAELRIPLGSSLQLVLFNDTGDAWGSIYQGSGLEQSVNFSLQDAVGVGLRVNTPLGVIGVDYGIGREGGRADFNIGQAF